MKKRNPYLTAGLILTGVLTGVIILGFFWTPYDPNAMAAGPKLTGPSLAHLMGTDSFGRDIFSRVLKGAGTTYGIALCTVAVGAVCGTVLGAVTGYFGGIVDDVLMRLGDVLTAFPSILLALVVISLLGPGKTGNVILALGLVFIPSFARMVRGKVLQVKEEDYIMATRSLGAKDSRIIFIHILKNCLPVIIVIATMRMATSIISISTLSYLGMGVVPPQPEWGGMIATGKQYLWDAPSLIFIPGIAVMITVICFNILGDKLRDILDPSLKD